MTSKFTKKDYEAMQWWAEKKGYRLTMTVYPMASFIDGGGNVISEPVSNLVGFHKDAKKAEAQEKRKEAARKKREEKGVK